MELHRGVVGIQYGVAAHSDIALGERQSGGMERL